MLVAKVLNRLENLGIGHRKGIHRYVDGGSDQANIQPHQSFLEPSCSRQKMIRTLDRNRNKTLALDDPCKDSINFLPADQPCADCGALVDDPLVVQDQGRLSYNQSIRSVETASAEKGDAHIGGDQDFPHRNVQCFPVKANPQSKQNENKRHTLTAGNGRGWINHDRVRVLHYPTGRCILLIHGKYGIASLDSTNFFRAVITAGRAKSSQKSSISRRRSSWGVGLMNFFAATRVTASNFVI